MGWEGGKVTCEGECSEGLRKVKGRQVGVKRKTGERSEMERGERRNRGRERGDERSERGR